VKNPRKKSKSLAQTADAEPGSEEAESLEAATTSNQQDDQEHQRSGAPQSHVPKGLHHSKNTDQAEAERIKLLQNKQIQALTSNLGKLEGKVSEMTKKYEELQKKDALKAQMEKEKA
jgi:hypothetical protein